MYNSKSMNKRERIEYKKALAIKKSRSIWTKIINFFGFGVVEKKDNWW